MAIVRSKLTGQGQISAPAEVCEKLGVGLGSVFVSDQQNDHGVVRRIGRYTSEDVHRALFSQEVGRKRPMDVKHAIGKSIRKRYASG